MIEISLLRGELLFAALWLLCREILWLRQKKIVWKREAVLLLMFVNLAVLIRFVFYPFFTVNGHVRPLMINHIGQLLLYVRKVIVRITPLEAFQKLVCLDGDGLCQIRRGVELIPVPLLRKPPDAIYSFLFYINHQN